MQVDIGANDPVASFWLTEIMVDDLENIRRGKKQCDRRVNVASLVRLLRHPEVNFSESMEEDAIESS